jgi:hypothetical protein
MVHTHDDKAVARQFLGNRTQQQWRETAGGEKQQRICTVIRSDRGLGNGMGTQAGNVEAKEVGCGRPRRRKIGRELGYPLQLGGIPDEHDELTMVLLVGIVDL